MAAINNKKTKSMECSYLKNRQLAFLLYSAGRAFWREYKEKHLSEYEMV